MSAPRPIEAEYLSHAERALSLAVGEGHGKANFELRLQVLEAASARFGGFDLAVFHEAFGIKSKRPSAELLAIAAPVTSAIECSSIHPALALSALARETLHEQDRKSTGAYHTDFRLATRLAQLAAQNLTHKSKVIDPASGAGILLVALTNAVCGMDRAKTAHWLAHGVCAADLSPNSLRAALLALASFTDDVSALKAMRARWYSGDSLMADREVWTTMAPEGFDAVIGNPPWEKVKLSRHEFLKSSGTKRHYGAHLHGLDEESFAQQRDEVANYSRRLLERYPDLGNGEPDLYIAFTDLFFQLCKRQGVLAALVPGGLIRSRKAPRPFGRRFLMKAKVSLCRLSTTVHDSLPSTRVLNSWLWSSRRRVRQRACVNPLPSCMNGVPPRGWKRQEKPPLGVRRLRRFEQICVCLRSAALPNGSSFRRSQKWVCCGKSPVVAGLRGFAEKLI